jgi:hypothetical protein
MDNDQLWQLILSIVRPTSTEEWMQTFKSLVKFTTPPQGYILDITKYDFYYIAIIEFIYLLKRVLKFLDWKAPEKYSPPMRTRDGRIGFMDIIWKFIPPPLGEKLHLGLSAKQVSDCSNIYEYLSFFSQQSQKIYDDSRIAKHNRLRYEGASALTADADINAKSNAATGKYNINPKLNYLNSLTPNPSMLLNNPYHDNEKSELPNSPHDFLKPVSQNRYNPLTDENVHEFDYYDAHMDDSSNDYSALNPMYHDYSDPIDKFQNLNIESDQVGTNNSNLHALDITRMRSLPCFGALMGTCKNRFCNYSHDKDILQAAYDKRMEELAASPFVRRPPPFTLGKAGGDQRRNTSFQASPFTPAGKPTVRPLHQLYEDKVDTVPQEDESDRVHRSGNRFTSAVTMPDPSTQVSILGRNVV